MRFLEENAQFTVVTPVYIESETLYRKSRKYPRRSQLGRCG
jgi:hypothetical protein